MATKFKIFCDEQQSEEKRTLIQVPQNPAQPSKLLADVKREPLGLRQTTSHAIPKTTTTLSQTSSSSSQQQPLTNATSSTMAATTTAPGVNLLNQSSSSTITSTTTTATTSTSTDEEDQENDISMASLGSDFVPSILNETQYDEDDVANYDDQSFVVDEAEDLEFDEDLERHKAYLLELEFDEDLEKDNAFILELDKALREHDESQLFKNTPYIDEIKTHLFNLEREPDLRPLPNYIEFQEDINSSKRAILIKWLVEVSDEYELEPETLFIAIGLIDRFLSKMAIKTQDFQLLGVAAMFIASKYEEIYPPNLYQLIDLTEDSYTGSQIRQMEQEILKALDFRIAVPTITYFLRQIFAFNKFSRKVYDLAEYLCYLSLVIDQPFLEYYPSEIATAAVILAAHQLDAHASISPDLWKAYDKSNTDQLKRRRQSPPPSPFTSSSSSSPSPSSKNLSHDNNQKITAISSNNNNLLHLDHTKSNYSSQDIDRRSYIVDQDLPLCIEALLAIQKRAYSKLAIALEDSSVTMDDSIIRKFLLPAHNGVALLVPPKDESSLLLAQARVDS